MEFEYRDILKDPLAPQELLSLGKLAEGGVKALLNLRSRNLKDLQVDHETMSEADLAQLMSEHPKTMIRPLYLKNGVLVIGFQESSLESML